MCADRAAVRVQAATSAASATAPRGLVLPIERSMRRNAATRKWAVRSSQLTRGVKKAGFRGRAGDALGVHNAAVNLDEMLGTAVAFLGMLFLSAAVAVALMYREPVGAVSLAIPGLALALQGLSHAHKARP